MPSSFAKPLTFLVASLPALGCRGQEPTGTTDGLLRVTYAPSPRTPKPEPEVDHMAVTKEGADIYRVEFGKCWAKARRPKRGVLWDIIEGSACETAQGPGKVTGGYVDLQDGMLHLNAKGLLDDGKTDVYWSFESLTKVR